jgi:hypothetical protein
MERLSGPGDRCLNGVEPLRCLLKANFSRALSFCSPSVEGARSLSGLLDGTALVAATGLVSSIGFAVTACDGGGLAETLEEGAAVVEVVAVPNVLGGDTGLEEGDTGGIFELVSAVPNFFWSRSRILSLVV